MSTEEDNFDCLLLLLVMRIGFNAEQLEHEVVLYNHCLCKAIAEKKEQKKLER